MNSSPKITRSHLERAALIYIRQSTLAQVRENTESTARQYALADTAVALGWDRGDVQISGLGRPLLPSTGCGRGSRVSAHDARRPALVLERRYG